jgi:ABC-type dipeptide/oligopeptide/nickel transport system permease component
LNARILVIFLLFDVFWGAQYAVFGVPILFGGRLGTYIPRPIGEVLSLTVLVVGTAIAVFTTIRSSKMEFFDEYVRISRARGRTFENIAYSQITKVTLIQIDSRAGYTFKVAFQVLGRPAALEVPKVFPGGSMITKESSEAKDFANWVKGKARLSNE